MERASTREARIIREARLRMGYTQQEVANIIGVHIRAYQRLEYGERDVCNASMKVGLILCSVLEINPIYLVFGDADAAIR